MDRPHGSGCGGQRARQEDRQQKMSVESHQVEWRQGSPEGTRIRVNFEASPASESESNARSGGGELLFHVFENNVSRFGIGEENHEELQNHHGGKEDKGGCFRVGGDHGELPGDDRIHDPVSGTAEALPSGAHVGGKDFADVDPDYRTLRESKGSHETDQEPDQKIAATPARLSAVPTEPTSIRVRRPTLSMIDMASVVKSRLVAPMATA